jgi:hypothetical protein
LNYIGQAADGTPMYRDTVTGLVWTATLGQVRSDENGVKAKAAVAQRGFRLPTFVELQNLYNFGGGNKIIRNGLFDYYETSDPAILANAAGNGIQTPQRRAGVGFNWVIGVK